MTLGLLDDFVRLADVHGSFHMVLVTFMALQAEACAAPPGPIAPGVHKAGAFHKAGASSTSSGSPPPHASWPERHRLPRLPFSLRTQPLLLPQSSMLSPMVLLPRPLACPSCPSPRPVSHQAARPGRLFQPAATTGRDQGRHGGGRREGRI